MFSSIACSPSGTCPESNSCDHWRYCGKITNCPVWRISKFRRRSRSLYPLSPRVLDLQENRKDLETAAWTHGSSVSRLETFQLLFSRLMPVLRRYKNFPMKHDCFCRRSPDIKYLRSTLLTSVCFDGKGQKNEKWKTTTRHWSIINEQVRQIIFYRSFQIHRSSSIEDLSFKYQR